MSVLAPSEIRIDPEFERLLRPLSEEERADLLVSIQQHGCREPLVVWLNHRILLDGHNRREICEDTGKDFDVIEISLPDRAAAIRWILKNQLSRRNLTQQEASIIRGQIFNADKKQVPNANGSNQHSDKEVKHQNDAQPKKTAAKVAAEFGVSQATIERDGKLAEAVEKLDPQVAADYRAGKTKLKKSEVSALADLPPEKQREAVSTQPTTAAPKHEKPFNFDVEMGLVDPKIRKLFHHWPQIYRKHIGQILECLLQEDFEQW